MQNRLEILDSISNRRERRRLKALYDRRGKRKGYKRTAHGVLPREGPTFVLPIVYVAADRKHPLFKQWYGMCHRCLSPKGAYYNAVQVYTPWKKFAAFKSYVETHKLYKPGLTIDRINTYGNYWPGNIRWADRKTQAQNSKSNKWHKFVDEFFELVELLDKRSQRVIVKYLEDRPKLDHPVNL